MVVLRCTRKLLQALDVKPIDAVAPSTNILGEWYAHLVGTAAGDLVVFANARTLLSVALPASAIPQLVPLFVARVYNLLCIIGVPERLAAQEIAAYQDVLFTRTADRSVLGSLNEIARYYQYVVETWEPDEPLSLQHIERELSRYLHKPLGYRYPADVAIEWCTKGQQWQNHLEHDRVAGSQASRVNKHMQGLDLCERFYREAVLPLIERNLPQLVGRHAAGLIGYGSDVLGYDDDYSRDHEWGPRGLIWLQEADYARYARELDQVLAAELPLAYRGYNTRFVENPALEFLVPAPAGRRGRHHVVLTTVSRHLRIGLGLGSLPPDTIEWLCLPEQKLLEFISGSIFHDPVGEITRARRELAYLPDEVWRSKLLYAWERIGHVDVVALNALRGDTLSARLNLARLVEAIVRIVFLLNRRYCPGTPKWLSRALNALPRLAGEIGPQLERCLALEDVRQGRALLDPILAALVAEHNRLGITRPVTLAAPDPIRERGLAPFSLQDVEDALRESLSPALRELAVHGGCDQWVSNDDLLLWPDQYQKFRHIYGHEVPIARDGIGDRML